MNHTDRNRIARFDDGRRAADLEVASRIQSQGIPWMLAKIDSATAIAGATNRWLYAWTRAEIRPTSVGSGHDFQLRSGELWETGIALNVCEAANSATFVGPGVNPAHIPAGFTVQPVGGYVMLWAARRTTETSGTPPTPVTGGGEIVWLFYSSNAIDGVC